MQQKSICFLKSGIQNQGGLEKYTLRLLNYFSALGHKVTLLTTDYDQESVTPYKVVNLGKRSKLTAWHLFTFDRKCKSYLEEHPQVVVFGIDRNFCPQTHYRAGNGVHRAYLERRKAQEGFLKSASFAVNPMHQLILGMEKKTFESDALQVLFTNSHMVKEEV